MKQIRKRLTYANVMSSIAVFLILGGATAVAAKKIGTGQLKASSVKTGKIAKEAVKAGKLAKNAVSTPKIANGAVTTEKIANDAVTGEKVNESTLGTVPTATNVSKLIPFGIVTASNGESKTLVSYGPFTLTGQCKEEGGNLGAYVVFSTTENGTSFGGDGENGGDIGPGTPESERIIEDPGASSAGVAENSDGYDDQFNAQAPSGASWAGTVESYANKNGNQCRWSGFIVTTS